MRTLALILIQFLLTAFILITLFYLLFHINSGVPRLSPLQSDIKTKLFHPKVIEALDDSVLQDIGWWLGEREGTFIYRNKQKDSPNQLRIGAYGDSFTYGSETEQGLDYPQLLQGIYHRAGQEHVEVLNFGQGWYGFHQSYNMWKATKGPYQIDIALFGPSTFFSYRDLSFDHTALQSPDAIHSRYVLKDQGVKHIRVEGKNFNHRHRKFHRFFQPIDYIRYNKQTPYLIRGFIPLGSGKINNPFYYTQKDEFEEASLLQSRLLEKASQNFDIHTILIEALPSFPQIIPRLKENQNISLHTTDQYFTYYPYYIRSHPSGLGNFLIAHVYYNLLNDIPLNNVPRFTFSRTQNPSPKSKDNETLDYTKISHIEVILGPLHGENNIRGSLRPQFNPEAPSSVNEDEQALLPFTEQTKSLLMISPPDLPIVSSVFWPLEVELEEGDKLKLLVEGKKYELGEIELLDERTKLYRLRSSKIYDHRIYNILLGELKTGINLYPTFAKLDLDLDIAFTLTLGEHILHRGKYRQEHQQDAQVLAWPSQTKNHLWKLETDPASFTSPYDLSTSGDISLIWHQDNKKTIRTPLGHYQIELPNHNIFDNQ